MITVLTPTFNRAHTLGRLFDSLCRQTDLSFEWLVIDDGSTDGTAAMLRELIRVAPFELRLVSQPNSGKHVAINTGVRESHGDWILIVDSDDALTPDAIETVLGDVVDCATADIAGLCYRRKYFDGTLVGKRMPPGEVSHVMHPTQAARYFGGDLAYLFGASSLRSCPFPVLEGEKFVPELYVWNLIGDDGKIIYFPAVAIYLCEYLADGYSRNFPRNLRRNPRGFGLFYRAQFWREKSMLPRLKCAIRAAQCAGFALWSRLRQCE